MAQIHVQGKSLRIGTICTIGRGKGCNLVISHGSISREHARIWREEGSWRLEDLHSANGTQHKGVPLLSGPVSLADGDAFQVGDIPMRFSTGGSTEAELDAPARQAGVRALDTLPGSELGGYAVVALERQEVAGPLFAARHHKTAREVLLWVLDPRVEKDEDPDFYQRFVSTLATAAAIKHPDLIRVYQCGRDDGLIWYATERPAGPTLAQLVHQGFTPRQALETVLKLCRLLHLYHQAGLVHCDIKPSLVHLDEAGRVRLGSFGLAGLNSVNRKRLQAEGATRQVFYLCPEQARTGNGNVHSDLYSIGCILVHLLTGRPPFIGNTYQEALEAHLTQPVPKLAERLGLASGFDDILEGMLSKNLFNRFDDLGPAIRDLEGVVAVLE